MSSLRKPDPNPDFVSEVQGSDIDFYDATGELEDIENIDLPYIEDISYVSMDNVEEIDDKALGTSGIFHCIGVAVPGENGYLAHATPGKIGETVDELLSDVDTDSESVTYALGGNPNMELLEEVRSNFEGYERTIYTGEDGSIAVDEKGEFYTVKESGSGFSLV